MIASLFFVTSVAGCNGGDDADAEDNAGGEGGAAQGGSGGASVGGSGGSGGSVVAGSGGRGGGGAMGGVAGGGAGGTASPLPPIEVGMPVDTEASLPIEVDFAEPTDLSDKFKVFDRDEGALAHDTGAGGRLKIAAEKEAVAFYDPMPQDPAGVGFTEFTASFKFQAAGPASVYFLLAGDDKRSDSKRVQLGINNGRAGPPGVADIDSIRTASLCSPQHWPRAEALCAEALGNAYAFTAMDGGPQVYTFEITTKKIDDTTLQVYGVFLEGDQVIDHQIYTFTGLRQLIGEIGIGGLAKGGDLFLDDFKVVAAKPIPDLKVLEHIGDDLVPWQLWLPEGTTPIKGLLHFSPGMKMAPGGAGEYAMFEVQRRFARAHGWGLLSHATKHQPSVTSLDAALAAFATASGHAEVATVPLFVESLLNSLANDYAGTHPEKTLGFFQNKLGNDHFSGRKVPMGQSDPFLKVPGVFTYAPLSTQAGLAATSVAVKIGRDLGALWARAAHGGQTHAVVDSSAFYLPFLERLIAVRLTNGAAPIKTVAKEVGYLGDHTPVFTTPGDFAPIAAYGSADDAEKSWLLDADMAKVFSGFHYNRFMGGDFAPKRVFMTAVPLPGKAGESRTLRAGFAQGFDWEKVEFFDMGRKLGEVTKNQEPQFEYQNVSKGAHALMAQATGVDGVIYLSHPVLLVMEP